MALFCPQVQVESERTWATLTFKGRSIPILDPCNWDRHGKEQETGTYRKITGHLPEGKKNVGKHIQNTDPKIYRNLQQRLHLAPGCFFFWGGE